MLVSRPTSLPGSVGGAVAHDSAGTQHAARSFAGVPTTAGDSAPDGGGTPANDHTDASAGTEVASAAVAGRIPRCLRAGRRAAAQLGGGLGSGGRLRRRAAG